MNDKFIEYLIGRGLRESTSRRYASDISKMEKWIEKPIEDWTDHDFNKLCMHLRGAIPGGKIINNMPDAYSIGTFRNYINTLDLYAKIFKLRGLKKMTEDVKENLKYKPKKPKPVISEIDVPKFLEQVYKNPVDDYQDPFLKQRAKFMVTFGYFFNTRISEIPIVKVDDVNEALKEIIIEDLKGIGGKFYEPCGDHLFWKYYKQYMQIKPSSQYLFCNTGGGKISVDTVYNSFRVFTPILRKFGVEYVNLTPHLTRRSRITSNSSKLSLGEGMYLSRHASSAAYDKYNKISMDGKTRNKLKDMI